MTRLKQSFLFQAFIRISLFFIFLEGFLRLGGFLFTSFQDYQNWLNIREHHEFRILCIGGSETALGGKETYPSLLETLLNSRQSKIKIAVINKGIPAVTTGEVAARMEGFLEKYKPNVVTTLLGAIDKYETSAPKTIWDKLSDGIISNSQAAKMIVSLCRNPPQKEPAQEDSKIKKDIPEKIATMIARLETVLKTAPSARGYTDLGKLYLLVNQKNEAFGYFQHAVDIDPRTYEAWYFMARHYKQLVDYPNAIKSFEKSLDALPGNISQSKLLIYQELADCHQLLKQYDKTEEYCRILISAAPQAAGHYASLGRCYLLQEKYDLAIPYFKRSLELDPRDTEIWARLAYCYRVRGDLHTAEELYETAMRINPQKQVLYAQLGDYFLEEKKYEQAVQIFQEGLKLKPQEQPDENVDIRADLDITKHLVEAYSGLGKYEEADKLKKKLVQSEGGYNLITQENYQKILKILSAKGIPLVAIQYPLRSVSTLKAMFGPSDNVIYVDNQKSFEEALAQGTYYDYFHDRIFGDFGHCTTKGNRILAENIAEAILRNVLNKRVAK